MFHTQRGKFLPTKISCWWLLGFNPSDFFLLVKNGNLPQVEVNIIKTCLSCQHLEIHALEFAQVWSEPLCHLCCCKLGLISKCHVFLGSTPPPHTGCNSGKWSFLVWGFAYPGADWHPGIWGRQIPVIFTPWTNLRPEPKKYPLEMEHHLPNLDFWVQKNVDFPGFFPMHVTNHHLRYLRLRAVWIYWRRHLPIHPTQPGCENCRHQEKWHETCSFLRLWNPYHPPGN